MPKIGPRKSAYRLYVEFLPAFQNPRSSFNYFSDDRKGEVKGRELLLLIRRVLQGSCRGRYRIAMLYTTINNQCQEVYTLEWGRLSYQDYLDKLHQQKDTTPLLKIYIICRLEYINILMQSGQQHPIIVSSRDYDPQTGWYGYDVALYHFRQMLLSSPFCFEFIQANVYRQKDNTLVARFNHLALLVFLEESFEEDIRIKNRYVK